MTYMFILKCALKLVLKNILDVLFLTSLKILVIAYLLDLELRREKCKVLFNANHLTDRN